MTCIDTTSVAIPIFSLQSFARGDIWAIRTWAVHRRIRNCVGLIACLPLFSCLRWFELNLFWIFLSLVSRRKPFEQYRRYNLKCTLKLSRFCSIRDSSFSSIAWFVCVANYQLVETSLLCSSYQRIDANLKMWFLALIITLQSFNKPLHLHINALWLC